MADTNDPPFSRRTATMLLGMAVAVFIVGVVSLALGWIEVATACAGVFTVMWLAMRRRMKKISSATDSPPAPTAPLREPRSARRRRPR